MGSPPPPPMELPPQAIWNITYRYGQHCFLHACTSIYWIHTSSITYHPVNCKSTALTWICRSTHCSSPVFYCMMSTSSLWRFRYFDFECILGYFGVSIIHWFLTGITWFLRYVCDLFERIIYTHGRPWCIVSFKDCTHVVHAPKVTQILFLFMVTLPQDHCAQVNVKSWYFIVWECLLQYNSSCY